MKELGYINSEEEYNTAIAEVDNGLNFQKGKISSGSDYSYHTDAVLDQVINQVINQGAKKPPFLGVDWLIDCKMLQFFHYIFVKNNNALRF